MGDFDLIVIGGGPGGYVAALRAGQVGLKVALVEREQVGGVCLNWGCIPTKSLLRSADVLSLVRKAETFGVVVSDIGFDFGRVFKRSRQVSDQLVSGVQHLLKKNKVRVVRGQAKLEAGRAGRDHGVRVGGDLLTAGHVIVATGSRPRPFPSDATSIWYYRQALAPDVLPGRLLIVGSGAIGIEFAHFYRSFGSEVILLESEDRILTAADHEISSLAQKAFEKQGIKVHTRARVKSVEDRDGGGARVVFNVGDSGETAADVDRVVMAIGVVPNSADLGLEALGVGLTPDGFIKVDKQCRTNVGGIWAIGDVSGPPCLAHKASFEAVVAVETLTGGKDAPLARSPDGDDIPSCIYGHPQIASIGLTELRAKERGLDFRVGRFPFIGNGKAAALGESDGLVKTIFDKKTGALLGAHMIGADVTELIGTYSVSKVLETTDESFLQAVLPHPTLSEMLHESVLSALGRALHI